MVDASHEPGGEGRRANTRGARNEPDRDDGSAWARGAEKTDQASGRVVEQGRVAAGPPALWSWQREGREQTLDVLPVEGGIETPLRRIQHRVVKADPSPRAEQRKPGQQGRILAGRPHACTRADSNTAAIARAA